MEDREAAGGAKYSGAANPAYFLSLSGLAQALFVPDREPAFLPEGGWLFRPTAIGKGCLIYVHALF